MTVPGDVGTPDGLAGLSAEEAGSYLGSYLAEGQTNVVHLQQEAHRHGVDAAFDVDALEEVIGVVYQATRFLPAEPDQIQRAFPALLTGTEKKLDSESLHGVLTLSYYLGETFVRSFPEALRWDVGDRGSTYANHPVVAGFRGGVEMAVAPVAQNVLLQAAESENPQARFASFVRAWRDRI